MHPAIYAVHPLEGVRPVQFGLSPWEVQLVFQEVPRVMKDGQRHAFLDGTFRVEFDQAGRAEFIELSRCDGFGVEWQGIDLLHSPVAEVLARLERRLGYPAVSPDAGRTYLVPELELRLCRQRLELESFSHFDVAAVARPGYSSGAPWE